MMMSPYGEKHSGEGVVELEPQHRIQASVHFRDGVAILAVKGELDGASTVAFRRAISGVLADGPRPLVIDFSELDFLGSAGVSVLLEARRRIGAGHRFALVSGPVTRRTIEILELGELLSLHATLGEAVRAVIDD